LGPIKQESWPKPNKKVQFKDEHQNEISQQIRSVNSIKGESPTFELPETDINQIYLEDSDEKVNLTKDNKVEDVQVIDIGEDNEIQTYNAEVNSTAPNKRTNITIQEISEATPGFELTDNEVQKMHTDYNTIRPNWVKLNRDVEFEWVEQKVVTHRAIVHKAPEIMRPQANIAIVTGETQRHTFKNPNIKSTNIILKTLPEYRESSCPALETVTQETNTGEAANAPETYTKQTKFNAWIKQLTVKTFKTIEDTRKKIRQLGYTFWQPTCNEGYLFWFIMINMLVYKNTYGYNGKIQENKAELLATTNPTGNAVSQTTTDKENKPTLTINRNFSISNGETKSTDDAYVNFPCKQAKQVVFTLLVDSGSDTSLLRIESIDEKQKINRSDTKFLRGAFGGYSNTAGSLTIQHKGIQELKFKMHAVHVGSSLPADGVLGRDILWNVSITDAINKQLIIALNENERAALPLAFTKEYNRVCIINEVYVRPRAIQTITVRVNETNGPVVIHKVELEKNVFVGGAITTVTNGLGYAPVMNLNDHAVKIAENSKIEYSMLDDYEILDNNGQTNICSMSSLSANERVTEIMKSIALDDSLNSEERDSMKRIFKDFHDVFKLEGDELTYTNILTHEIPTDPCQPPVNVKQYRIPEAHKAEINRQVKEMLDQGIIEPSTSPWNSPIILVSKKPGADGKKKWRLVVDFKKVNEQTIKQVFPIPRIDEILDQLGHSRYFTTLDLASGYHQVLVDGRDRHKTAFSTQKGHYEFVRMPFGLTGAPATFQRIMNCILSGLQGKDCFVYLDDIAIHAKNLKDHEERLRKVLQVLRESNLKVQTEKCQFLRKEVVYLGHVCSEQGVLPDPGKVECVKKHKEPKNVKQLQAFLGLVNYYRKFIPNAAEILLPLTNLLKKNQKFDFTKECKEAMETLKLAIASPPILQYPDFKKPFLLTTDASNGALGAILSQGEIGEDLPIAFASRALSDTERRYSTIEKEFLAIVWAVKNFRAYLLGRPFTIYTDHKPLKGIHNLKDQTSRLAKFKHKLSEFDYTIQYRPGIKNQNANALSRIDYGDLTNVAVVTRAKAKEMKDRQSQQENSKCEESKGGKEEILLPKTQIEGSNNTQDLNTEKDPLVMEPVWLESEKDIREALNKFHDGPMGGHKGVRATYNRIRRQYCWKGMFRQVKQYVLSCQACQRNKTNKVDKAPMVITDTPSKPFDKIYIDMVGPFPISLRQNEYVLTAQDAFSKYFICAPMPDGRAETAAKTFFEYVVARYGMPKMLVSDNGKNFVAEIMQELCKLLQIKKFTTSPYHPQANGGLERSHKPLSEFLRCVVQEDTASWDEWLPHAMCVYNSTVHSSTKQSPNKIVLGFDLEVPTNIKRKPSPVYNHDDYTKILKFQLQRMHELVRQHLQKEKEKSKEYYDRNAKDRHFIIGQKVWLKNQTRKNKLSPIWEGPYEVTGIPSNVNIRILVKGKDKVYHKNLVKACHLEQINFTQTNCKVTKIAEAEDLVELLDDLTTNGWKRIDKEYKEIRKVNPNDHFDTASLKSNKKRNRYQRPTCNEGNRVRLSNVGSDASDYINANYVDGFKRKNAYICTQGPLAKTVSHFWSMIWDQNVADIVMLTNLIENGFPKCHPYWGIASNSVVECGNFKVHTREIKNEGEYQMCRLELVNYETQEMRQITHWWYRNWADQGVTNTNSILKFAKQINIQRNNQTSVNETPLVVHCSAGIGRTGTFVALNNCLSELYHTGQINVGRVVRKIRDQRAYSVTTSDQYRLIYKTLLAWARDYMNLKDEVIQKIRKVVED